MAVDRYRQTRSNGGAADILSLALGVFVWALDACVLVVILAGLLGARSFQVFLLRMFARALTFAGRRGVGKGQGRLGRGASW